MGRSAELLFPADLFLFIFFFDSMGFKRQWISYAKVRITDRVGGEPKGSRLPTEPCVTAPDVTGIH
jgi:hypothetical protein